MFHYIFIIWKNVNLNHMCTLWHVNIFCMMSPFEETSSFILVRYEPKLNLPFRFCYRPPIPNLIRVQTCRHDLPVTCSLYILCGQKPRHIERFICDFSCRYTWAQNKKWSFHVCWKDYDGIHWNNSFGWLVSVLFQLYSAALQCNLNTFCPFAALQTVSYTPWIARAVSLLHHHIAESLLQSRVQCNAVWEQRRYWRVHGLHLTEQVKGE
jgi:hypothetical protein